MHLEVQESLLLSDPKILAVRASYCAAIKRLSPQLVNAGCHLLDRVSTPNWTLEWHLPRWLGDAFGLSPEKIQALVLSNVYGLTYVRLQDDLVDDEVSQATRITTIPLATALYHLWMLQYVQLFAGESPFWTYLERFMAQWMRATQSSNKPPATGFQSYSEEDFLRLGERGAPLKICCAGACLLAGRDEVISPLTSAVDHLLVSAVLMDHAKDWADDLTAGRYNVFVDYASPRPQAPHRREANRRQVLEEICLGDAARPYFDVLQRHVQIAAEKARAVACPGLIQHLQLFESGVVTIRDRLADEAKAWLRMATEQLFGSSLLSDPPAIPEERM